MGRDDEVRPGGVGERYCEEYDLVRHAHAYSGRADDEGFAVERVDPACDTRSNRRRVDIDGGRGGGTWTNGVTLDWTCSTPAREGSDGPTAADSSPRSGPSVDSCVWCPAYLYGN